MLWVNALSCRPSLALALSEVVAKAEAQLRHSTTRAKLDELLAQEGEGSLTEAPMTEVMARPVRADLAVLFVSAAYAADYDQLLPLWRSLLPDVLLIGCGGWGIAGGGEEVEAAPAVSLSLAVLPDVILTPFHLDSEQLPDLDAAPAAWRDLIGVSPRVQPHFLLLGDGFSAKVEDLLAGLDFAYPSATKVGGLASGGTLPEHNVLFVGDRLHRTGVVGLALAGNIVVETVVAQGCRPIGEPLQLTEVEHNIVLGLAGEAPLSILQDLMPKLSPADQALARHSLFLGVVMDGFKEQPVPGDFLIRNILGIDPRSGAMAVGDRLRPGQVVQFHLRDANTSADDLRWVLSRYQDGRQRLAQGEPVIEPAGALLFSCVGRGANLYGIDHHDTRLFQGLVGDLPLGGFFGNGEIGPVGGTTFLHGYTSVFAMFRPLTTEVD